MAVDLFKFSTCSMLFLSLPGIVIQFSHIAYIHIAYSEANMIIYETITDSRFHLEQQMETNEMESELKCEMKLKK